jgi:hypothetical protein
MTTNFNSTLFFNSEEFSSQQNNLLFKLTGGGIGVMLFYFFVKYLYNKFLNKNSNRSNEIFEENNQNIGKKNFKKIKINDISKSLKTNDLCEYEEESEEDNESPIKKIHIKSRRHSNLK